MHSIPDPSTVRFVGPLAPFAAGLAAELEALGFATTSAVIQLQLSAHLSRWLAAEHLGTADLTDPVIERFLVARRRSHTNHYSRRSLAPMLGYLRRIGVTPLESAPPPPSAADPVLTRFRRYLLVERSLTVPVADAYSHWVAPFVEHVTGTAQAVELGPLAAIDVTGFLTAYLPGLSRKSAQITACSLRSFLRFLHAQGMVEVALADTVPAVAFRRLSGLPKALTPGQVQALLGACDRSTPVGRRDFAVITVLYRLALRSGEIRALLLDDVDWVSGSLTVHGKGNRIDQLPVPVDVGQALVDYLRNGRPDTPARTVFVRARAPFTMMANSGISCIVARAARRAGLGTIHAHRLRHTAATRTLNAGASLEEVAHMLRHASPATTAIYAKTDMNRLASLERPWPTAGATS